MYQDGNLGILGLAIPGIPTIIGGAGTIIRGAKDIIGGVSGESITTGSLYPTVDGIGVCDAGPVPWEEFSLAWDNAPAREREALWRSIIVSQDAQSEIRRLHDTSRDDIRSAIIARAANGAGDCRIDSDRNRNSARLAHAFMVRFGVVTQPITDQPAQPGPALLAGPGGGTAILLGGALLAAILLGGGRKRSR